MLVRHFEFRVLPSDTDNISNATPDRQIDTWMVYFIFKVLFGVLLVV